MIITPAINLGELVAAHPQTVTYLFDEWGLHCVNCFANQFDTLEAGMRLHGYNDQQIQEAVEGLKCLLAQ